MIIEATATIYDKNGVQISSVKSLGAFDLMNAHNKILSLVNTALEGKQVEWREISVSYRRVKQTIHIAIQKKHFGKNI